MKLITPSQGYCGKLIMSAYNLNFPNPWDDRRIWEIRLYYIGDNLIRVSDQMAYYERKRDKFSGGYEYYLEVGRVTLAPYFAMAYFGKSRKQASKCQPEEINSFWHINTALDWMTSISREYCDARR